MPFTVLDCTRAQLIELKQFLLCQRAETDGDEPSWGELANADELVPDTAVYNYFDGITFTDEDFSTKEDNAS